MFFYRKILQSNEVNRIFVPYWETEEVELYRREC